MNKVLQRIDSICQQKCISKYKLAKDSNIPYTTIANAFRNDTMPTILTLENICNGLGVTMSQFFNENESRNTILTNDQKRVLDMLELLDRNGQEKVISYMQGLIDGK